MRQHLEQSLRADPLPPDRTDRGIVVKRHPQKIIPVPEDTLYLVLGVLRLVRDGVINPESNIETAMREIKECFDHHSLTTAPKITIEDVIKIDRQIRYAQQQAARTATLATLSLLEDWDRYNNRNFLKPHPTFHDMIRIVRENPEKAREQVESLRNREASADSGSET
jgi:hypothetical protein